MSSSANPCQFSAMSILCSGQEAQDQCYEDVQTIHTRTNSSHGVSQLPLNLRYSKACRNKPVGLALQPFLVLGSFVHSACAQSILTAMTTRKAASFHNMHWLPIPTRRRLQFIGSAISCHPEETGMLKWLRRNGTHLKQSIYSHFLSVLYAGGHSGDA
jgi:hypothetical protein